MRFLLTTILILGAFRVTATHIVGGEFEIIHEQGYLYTINMILYFDHVNGTPEAEDNLANAIIFNKKNNQQVQTITLFNRGSTFVPYTNNECAIGELVTRRILYSGSITMAPEIFNEPEGYYMIYDRCCRNNTINNISFPGGTGQLFYIEFPPVIKKDIPFINSSPILFPPLSDYACINEFYYVNFGGFDPDGDSLVYSMAHPLAGFSNQVEIIPPPRPAPYPVVQWVNGISTNNSIPGTPPLSISKDGLLTVVPTLAGLFVFSVLCEEFRDGIKIGETRRDFQMLVVDCQPQGSKPDIVVKNPDTNTFTDNPDPFYFTLNEEKCIEFAARDKDGRENITFRAYPVNFSANLNGYFTVREGHVEGEEDSLKVEFCFPDCPFTPDQPHIIDIIAGDDACPLPLLDTVRLYVYVEPPPNTSAYFDTTVTHLEYNIREGDILQIDLRGLDNDGDLINYQVIGSNIDTADFDLVFEVVNSDSGSIDLRLEWDSSCEKYDFNLTNDLELLLTIDDQDYCNILSPDIMKISIHVELPPNTPPVISSDLGTDSIGLKILDELFFQIIASDSDQDSILLNAEGIDFDLETYGFSPLSLSGIGSLSEYFSWILECNTVNLDEIDQFSVLFTVEDDDKCKIKNGDSLLVKFTALLPENAKPQITITGTDSSPLEIIAGDSIQFEILGIDPDGDFLILDIIDQNNLLESTGAVFIPTAGKSSVKTSFRWNTNCSHIGSDFSSIPYNYTFVVHDDKCLVPASDSVDISLIVKNQIVDYDIFIPNVFTPNNDGINESFMVDNLPEDNCINQFYHVSIYNRYGKEVFFSKERDFKWIASNVDNGIYYYQIKYSGKDYRGYLHVLY